MINTAIYTDATRLIRYRDPITIEYDDLTHRIAWSGRDDMLVFNPNEVPEIMMSALMFDAKKKFRVVGLIDDLVADNDYENMLKNHGFINVRMDAQLGMVIGYCNSSTRPLIQ